MSWSGVRVGRRRDGIAGVAKDEVRWLQGYRY
jgi:hypothetical protein